MSELTYSGHEGASECDGHVWYSDGDICAYILDNLALGIIGEDMARLFAASPDLYAALWALLPQAIAAAGILETYGHDIAEMCVTFKQAAVAIGKAESRDE